MECEIELPSFVEIIDKDTVKVKTSDWKGEHENIVTRDDIERYWKSDAHNLGSGYRRIGKIGGDWRPIHDLAELLKDIFEELSMKA